MQNCSSGLRGLDMDDRTGSDGIAKFSNSKTESKDTNPFHYSR